MFILILTAAGSWFLYHRVHQFIPKRQNNEQIIAYRDSKEVVLFYHNSADSTPEEIRVELCIGDGPVEVARSLVLPNETVTIISTSDGKPCNLFTAGIYAGRILVYEAETGQLKSRKDGLEFRLYSSRQDAYDTLQSPQTSERKVVLDKEEYRPSFLKMSVDLKTEEIRAGLYGLVSEWRELNSYIYAEINGEELLVAKAERLPPRSIAFNLYLEPGIAEILSAGKTLSTVHVDSYYADTGTFYDSIPAEIYEIINSE